MKNYFDITVLISPEADGNFSVRVSSEQGGQGNSTLKLPFRLRDLSGAVFGVAQTARAIGSITPGERGSSAEGATDPRSAADFGVELFEALFQGEARDVLVATDSMAQNVLDTGVRIRLSMDLKTPGMAEVAGLPWELMCRKGQRPLVVSTQTPLVRSLDTPRPMDPRPFRGPLRILALMSNPTGTAALNLDAERSQIEQNWARLPDVAVDFVRPVRAAILDQLAAKDYHVIHYMGHGDFDADEGGMLLLELADGSPDPISGDDFAMWLADEPLRLVFLNACKTGATGMRSGAHPFAGVAAALIRERVPAVVAMQFPISDQAAIAFAQTFYKRISQGLPVDAAVAEGRKVLYSNKQAEWATPVLYLRSKDGMLFGSGSDDVAVASDAPLGGAQGLVAATRSALAKPSDAAAGDTLRVFLATPDQDREKLHQQLCKALQAVDGVSVFDPVPLDEQRHAELVESLVGHADLCVHLLGANAGKRLDVDDGEPLRTYPLVELEIGRQGARSQLVVITSEDRESIDNAKYAARIDEFAKLPRDKARFELVITDRNRIKDEVLAKVAELKSARQAALAPSAIGAAVQSAFVDSHDVDQDSACDLVSFLSDRNVDAFMQTSEGSASNDLAKFGNSLKQYPLYILVAGKADKVWVKNRTNAARASAVKSRAAILIGRYEESGGGGITLSRLKVVAAIKREVPDPIDSLFTPVGVEA